MGWKYGGTYSRELKTHPDLVPYAELGRLERDKDEVFMALCDIARLYVRTAEATDVVDRPAVDELELARRPRGTLRTRLLLFSLANGAYSFPATPEPDQHLSACGRLPGSAHGLALPPLGAGQGRAAPGSIPGQ